MKYTVTAERIQAQFVATTQGQLRRPVHHRRPEPGCRPRRPPSRRSTVAHAADAPPATGRRQRRWPAAGPSPRPATGCWAPTAPSTPSARPAASAVRPSSRPALGRRRRTHPVGRAATGCSTTAVRSAPSATPPASAGVPPGRRWARARFRRACRPHRAGRATGSSPTGAGPSPSATPASSATSPPCALNGPVLDSVATPSGQGLLHGRLRRRHLRLRRRPLRRLHGRQGAQRAGPVAGARRRRRRATGWWRPTAASSPSTRRSRGRWAAKPLAKPVTGMVRYGDGYLMVGEDGGIFNFSSLGFAGSLGGQPAGPPDRVGGRPPLTGERSGPPGHDPGRPVAARLPTARRQVQEASRKTTNLGVRALLSTDPAGWPSRCSSPRRRSAPRDPSRPATRCRAARRLAPGVDHEVADAGRSRGGPIGARRPGRPGRRPSRRGQQP